MLQRHQVLTAGVGANVLIISFLFTSPDMRRLFIVAARAKNHRSSSSIDFRSDVPLFFFFFFFSCPRDFDEWQKANLFAVLYTISSYDNHILTVQMRKWLIGLVINIMSYYPGQRNYFIKPGYIYLCSPMHLFCSFHSVLLHVRL